MKRGAWVHGFIPIAPSGFKGCTLSVGRAFPTHWLTNCPSGSPVASSRESLAAVAHGGNPQDRAALPTHWLTNYRVPNCQ
ncbi:hypothetical protein PI95_033690 [Hassallia byssoidea VB512170]|uniref:Uncharacterized protein n=1 Tax=Hassallia byssoidea VB512170 TaxID=1304833 RepID=A0A846HLX5_9CYAN|nr:hypothetical protein [Hassalia byssoidea]NEU77304.1 hypothetical protein [Hassalia byssoidea VB512170]